QTYSVVLNRTLANDNVTVVPGIAVDPATSITLAGWIRSSHEVVAIRSTDSGATWGVDQVLASTAAGGSKRSETFPPLSAARTSTGTWVVAWTDQRSDTYTQLLTDIYARSSTDGGVSWGLEQRVDGGTAGAHQSVLDGVAA